MKSSLASVFEWDLNRTGNKMKHQNSRRSSDKEKFGIQMFPAIGCLVKSDLYNSVEMILFDI